MHSDTSFLGYYSVWEVGMCAWTVTECLLMCHCALLHVCVGVCTLYPMSSVLVHAECVQLCFLFVSPCACVGSCAAAFLLKFMWHLREFLFSSCSISIASLFKLLLKHIQSHTLTSCFGVTPRFEMHSVPVAFNGIPLYLPQGDSKPAISTRFPNWFTNVLNSHGCFLFHSPSSGLFCCLKLHRAKGWPQQAKHTVTVNTK